MKKVLFIIVILTILFTSCAKNKTIDGVTYRPYGVLNQEAFKNDSINYVISGWAVVSGVIFIELIIPPIYTFGYNLYEPVSKKTNNPTKKGVISNEDINKEFNF